MNKTDHWTRYAALCALGLTAATVSFGDSNTAATGSAAASNSTKTDNEEIDEIVVTAERREVGIQHAPLLISATRGADIAKENIADVTVLQSLVPDVQVLSVGAQPGVYIRGVGTAVASALGDPDANFSVDGITIARPVSVTGALYDLDRVEILKGPQGTLYGRNSTVGAINIVSTNPGFEFGGDAGLEFGNYALVRSDGAVNLPVNDTLAFRVAFQTLKHSGYLSSGANDADNEAARVGALWKPNDVFSALLKVSYFHDTGAGVGDVPLKSPTGSFLYPSNPWFVAVGPVNGVDQVPNNAKQDLRTTLVSGEFNADLGFATATLLPGYVMTGYNAITYDGGFQQHYDTPDRERSLEMRLASPSNQRIQWLVGALYLYDQQHGPLDIELQPGAYSRTDLDTLDSTSRAIFGQTTLTIVDGFRLVGGLRYSHESKSMQGALSTVTLDLSPLPLPVTQIIGDRSDNNVSYKAGFEYDISSDSLLYANVSTGFKAGGFNVGTPPNTFQPEKMTAFTVGSKNRFLDNKLIANVEGWYWIYKDVDEPQFGLANPLPSPENPFPNIQLLTYNAAEIKSYGVEAQIEYLIWRGGKLSSEIAYNDAKFTEFQLPAFIFGPFNIPPSNLSGQSTPFSPPWAGNLAFEQRFELGAAGAVVADASGQIKSSERIQPGTAIGSVTGGTGTADISLTYQRPNDQWEVQGWIKNITNEPVIYFAGNTPAGLWGHPGAPRTCGISARVHF
jgi:iron complex outermembrane receptor protein